MCWRGSSCNVTDTLYSATLDFYPLLGSFVVFYLHGRACSRIQLSISSLIEPH